MGRFKMKAFVAVLSLIAAVSAGPAAQVVAAPGYAYGGYAGYAPYTYAAQPLAYATYAQPAALPIATVNPYDYAGQVYPAAEPYIHEEVAAEPYVHEEIEAEPYIHTEIEAEPYVHEEVAAEPYVHTEVAAEPYVHAEVAAEPYIHQEPIAVAVAAP